MSDTSDLAILSLSSVSSQGALRSTTPPSSPLTPSPSSSTLAFPPQNPIPTHTTATAMTTPQHLGVIDLPIPGTKNAPKKFKGKYSEIKPFVQHYERLCLQKGVTDAQEKIENITQYCSRDAREFMEGLSSYKSGNWDQFTRDLLEFYDAERDSKRYRPKDLVIYVKNWKSDHKTIRNLSSWKEYNRGFIKIAGWLKKEGKITEDTQAITFWKGIPKPFRHRLEARLLAKTPDHDLSNPFSMESIHKAAKALLQRNRFDREGYLSDGEDDESEDEDSEDSDRDSESSDSDSDSSDDEKIAQHVKKLRKKRKEKMSREKLKKKKKSEQEEKPEAKINKSARPTRKKEKDSEVEELINQLNKMSLEDPAYAISYFRACRLDPLVADIVPKPNERHQRINAQPSGQFFNNSSRPPMQRQMPPHMDNAPTGDRRCFGCGIVSRDPAGCYVMANGQPIMKIAFDEPLATAAVRLHPTPQANFIAVNHATIEEVTDEDYQEVGEDGELSDDEGDGRNAAWPVTRTPKSTTAARKEKFEGVLMPPRKFLDKRDEKTRSAKGNKENVLPRKKNFEYPSNGKIPEPVPVDVERDIPVDNHSDIIMDEELGMREPLGERNASKNLENHSPEKRIPRHSEIQAQVDRLNVLTKVLNTPVTLAVGEVFGMSKEMSTHLLDVLKPKPATKLQHVPKATAALARTSASFNSSAVSASFIARSRGTLIKLKMHCDNVPVDAIIDTGSQLNIAHEQIWKDVLARPMDKGRKISMSDANGGEGMLSGLVPNVPLNCGGVLTHANIYVGTQVPFKLLLGRPWQRGNYVSIDEREDGTYLLFKDKHLNVRHELLVNPEPTNPSLNEISDYLTYSSPARVGLVQADEGLTIEPDIPEKLLEEEIVDEREPRPFQHAFDVKTQMWMHRFFFSPSQYDRPMLVTMLLPFHHSNPTPGILDRYAIEGREGIGKVSFSALHEKIDSLHRLKKAPKFRLNLGTFNAFPLQSDSTEPARHQVESFLINDATLIYAKPGSELPTAVQYVDAYLQFKDSLEHDLENHEWKGPILVPAEGPPDPTDKSQKPEGHPDSQAESTKGEDDDAPELRPFQFDTFNVKTQMDMDQMYFSAFQYDRPSLTSIPVPFEDNNPTPALLRIYASESTEDVGQTKSEELHSKSMSVIWRNKTPQFRLTLGTYEACPVLTEFTEPTRRRVDAFIIKGATLIYAEPGSVRPTAVRHVDAYLQFKKSPGYPSGDYEWNGPIFVPVEPVPETTEDKMEIIKQPSGQQDDQPGLFDSKSKNQAKENSLPDEFDSGPSKTASLSFDELDPLDMTPRLPSADQYLKTEIELSIQRDKEERDPSEALAARNLVIQLNSTGETNDEVLRIRGGCSRSDDSGDLDWNLNEDYRQLRQSRHGPEEDLLNKISTHSTGTTHREDHKGKETYNIIPEFSKDLDSLQKDFNLTVEVNDKNWDKANGRLYVQETPYLTNDAALFCSLFGLNPSSSVPGPTDDIRHTENRQIDLQNLEEVSTSNLDAENGTTYLTGDADKGQYLDVHVDASKMSMIKENAVFDQSVHPPYVPHSKEVSFNRHRGGENLPFFMLNREDAGWTRTEEIGRNGRNTYEEFRPTLGERDRPSNSDPNRNRVSQTTSGDRLRESIWSAFSNFDAETLAYLLTRVRTLLGEVPIELGLKRIYEYANGIGLLTVNNKVEMENTVEDAQALHSKTGDLLREIKGLTKGIGQCGRPRTAICLEEPERQLERTLVTRAMAPIPSFATHPPPPRFAVTEYGLRALAPFAALAGMSNRPPPIPRDGLNQSHLSGTPPLDSEYPTCQVSITSGKAQALPSIESKEGTTYSYIFDDATLVHAPSIWTGEPDVRRVRGMLNVVVDRETEIAEPTWEGLALALDEEQDLKTREVREEIEDDDVPMLSLEEEELEEGEIEEEWKRQRKERMKELYSIEENDRDSWPDPESQISAVPPISAEIRLDSASPNSLKCSADPSLNPSRPSGATGFIDWDSKSRSYFEQSLYSQSPQTLPPPLAFPLGPPRPPPSPDASAGSCAFVSQEDQTDEDDEVVLVERNGVNGPQMLRYVPPHRRKLTSKLGTSSENVSLLEDPVVRRKPTPSYYRSQDPRRRNGHLRSDHAAVRAELLSLASCCPSMTPCSTPEYSPTIWSLPPAAPPVSAFTANVNVPTLEGLRTTSPSDDFTLDSSLRRFWNEARRSLFQEDLPAYVPLDSTGKKTTYGDDVSMHSTNTPSIKSHLPSVTMTPTLPGQPVSRQKQRELEHELDKILAVAPSPEETKDGHDDSEESEWSNTDLQALQYTQPLIVNGNPIFPIRSGSLPFTYISLRSEWLLNPLPPRDTVPFLNNIWHGQDDLKTRREFIQDYHTLGEWAERDLCLPFVARTYARGLDDDSNKATPTFMEKKRHIYGKLSIFTTLLGPTSTAVIRLTFATISMLCFTSALMEKKPWPTFTDDVSLVNLETWGSPPSATTYQLTEFSFGQSFIGINSRINSNLFYPQLEPDDECIYEMSGAEVLTAYKRVDKKVKPVPGVFPEESRVRRQFPENPLDSLPPLSCCPPQFKENGRLTQKRLDGMNINPDGFLSLEEENLFKHILQLNQNSLVFEEEHRGTFREDYFTPYIIPTVPHIPWAYTNIPIPPGIREKVVTLLKEKMAASVYEQSQSSYRSRWFCVLKKSGKLRLVHDLQPLNAVTIHDAGLPPILDAFVEPFAGRRCYTAFDLYWGFDARKIHEKSRDMTAFLSPLGLLRLTSLPTGFTNSPAEF
ncbi:unnamed protein product [Somion occarium]|uniref:DUF4100 domain-containing protein n=1 Tax=Somion occarium TaxID=3059160 RepID=A0ABP1DXC1_9APHY